MTLFTDGRLQTYERMMQQVDYNTPSRAWKPDRNAKRGTEEHGKKDGGEHGSDSSKEE